MDSWKRFNETTLSNKKAFYSQLYPEDVTNNTMHMLKKYL